jgi:hypothetical protein
MVPIKNHPLNSNYSCPQGPDNLHFQNQMGSADGAFQFLLCIERCSNATVTLSIWKKHMWNFEAPEPKKNSTLHWVLLQPFLLEKHINFGYWQAWTWWLKIEREKKKEKKKREEKSESGPLYALTEIRRDNTQRVLGGIGILERHAPASSQRRAAHHQAVVELDPLKHAGVERASGGERRASHMDVLELAVAVHAQVGDLHAEGRNAVAVAAPPLRDADVRLAAQGRGSSQLPVHKMQAPVVPLQVGLPSSLIRVHYLARTEHTQTAAEPDHVDQPRPPHRHSCHPLVPPPTDSCQTPAARKTPLCS